MWIKIRSFLSFFYLLIVTSFTLVWIKICAVKVDKAVGVVTSFTLVWIKIRARVKRYQEQNPSRASRSCGLK